MVAAAAVLLAASAPAPASGREGAPVAGVLIERMVTAVVAVHADGRPPEVSELAGFERRVDPSGRTLSEGPFPVPPGPEEPVGVFGCAARGTARGFRDHSAAGPVRLDVDVAGDTSRSVFHLYSLAGGRTVDGRPTLQVLACMAGRGQAGEGRRLLQAGIGAAYDDTEHTHLLGRVWLDGDPAAREEAGFSFFGAADTGADGWVEQEPAGKVEGSLIGPFESGFNDYFRNAAVGWWQHPCLDDGPVCGPADGSTAFQGSLASAVWEFYDDAAARDHRFRVAAFFAVACANPAACP